MSEARIEIDWALDAAEAAGYPTVRARDAFADLEAEVEELRNALEFYADPATYQETAPVDNALDGIVPIKADRGERARSVLDG
jgi:hypothetical protein